MSETTTRVVNARQVGDVLHFGWTMIASRDAVNVVFPTERHYWKVLASAPGLADGRSAIEGSIDDLCAALKAALMEKAEHE